MNSVDYEACAFKILKLNIGEGHEGEICNMILECGMQERTYLRFHGLLA
jgi:pre-mRNA-splicing factor CWC22